MAVSESFESFLTRGQALLEDLFPGTLRYDGTDYTCAHSGARVSNELEAGGFYDTAPRNIRVLKTLLVTPPSVGDIVQLDGEDARVADVGERAWDVCWHMSCEPLRGV